MESGFREMGLSAFFAPTVRVRVCWSLCLLLLCAARFMAGVAFAERAARACHPD
jgi:hypothetical protein